MSIFNGSAENIENNLNKVSSVDENSTDKQYPSAKVVYDRTKDYIVEQGYKNGWYYEKWNSGLVKLYSHRFMDTASLTVGLPFAMVESYYVGATMNQHLNYTYAPTVSVGAELVTGDTLQICTDTEPISQYVISAQIIGTWK